ncbi:hypothetical protein LCGC14_2202290 [marine sediment metagenome]|uniref:Uncharacterized protein n=1 Tax=marine sediment metagenome TaxID=412755 RepID=A0A0F9DGD4_9ZZZZ
MASTFDYPQKYYAWIIRGDDLGIIQQKVTSGNPNADWIASEETITDGVLINFLAEPDAVTALTDYPDIDNTLHKFVADFVKAELYMEEAGKAAMGGNENRATMLERLSLRHEKRWTDELVKFGMKKRDKIGGMRQTIPMDFR